MSRGSSRVVPLTNPGSLRYALENLLSGVAPPPDMFLYAYSLIDLLAHRFTRRALLERYSVNGFVQSRAYATERSAELHHYSLAKIFASPSYLTSAASYQNLVKYSFRDPDPMMWILKGNTQQHFLRRLQTRLKSSGARSRKGGRSEVCSSPWSRRQVSSWHARSRSKRWMRTSYPPVSPARALARIGKLRIRRTSRHPTLPLSSPCVSTTS